MEVLTLDNLDVKLMVLADLAWKMPIALVMLPIVVQMDSVTIADLKILLNNVVSWTEEKCLTNLTVILKLVFA